MDIKDFIIALSTSVSLSAKSITRLSELNKATISKTKIRFPLDFAYKDQVLELVSGQVAGKIREICAKHRIIIITYLDKDYPPLLKEIPDFPPVLYVLGNSSLLSDKMNVAVVGSRRPSGYGLAQTTRFVRELSAHLTIVSGLALGIDGQAHKVCLESSGKTIAVLGSAIDRIYPVSNEPLAKRIIESRGAIVSEYPPGFPTQVYNFPLRNRIIAGLSKAVLVMEAASSSGSLITASLATEYNREVFALPGSVESLLSRGTNEIIRQGANILLDSEAVLQVYGISREKRIARNLKNLDSNSEKIVKILADGAMGFDKIQNLTKIDVATLNALLVNLEIDRMVSRKVSGEYVLLTE